MEKLTFITEDNEEAEFYIVADTRIGGVNYLLVTDSEEDEAEAYILKDTADEGETESRYVFVEDDAEFEAVAKMFEEDLDEVEFRE